MVLRKLTYVSLIFLVFFIGLEVVLRFTTSQFGAATIPDNEVLQHVRNGAMAYDPVLGWVRAELPLWGEGINEVGFRYIEPLTVEKPPTVFRAFALGDSQTYGAGVKVGESYPAVAESILRADHPDLQLINAGISGYSSLQALRLIQTRLMDWDPDLFIVDCRTYDSPRDTALPPRDTFPALEQLLFHWRTYYVLRLMVQELQEEKVLPMRASSAGTPRAELRNTAGNHDLIAEFVQDQGKKLLFLDYPFWNSRDDNIQCLGHVSEMPSKVPVARVCDALKADGRPPKQLFLDNNHLTVEGNKVVGAVVAQAIQEHFLTP